MAEMRIFVRMIVTFWILIAIAGSRCNADALAVNGIVVDGAGPVSGATVRVRASDIAVPSGSDGRFTLYPIAGGAEVEITAWAAGHYIATTHAQPPADGIELVLRPLHTEDHPDYVWTSPVAGSSEGACGNCHPSIISQWSGNAHGGAISNARFFSLYNGTDLTGDGQVSPGYLEDFPGTKGICASCHAPGAAVDGYLTTDMNQVRGEITAGIHCDFCHKVGGVYLNPATQIVYNNAPGVQSERVLRPPPGDNVFFGPFDDIHDPDTYLPLTTESRFCAACHQFSFWGTPIYESYGEWLRSPYAESGVTCQDCHMSPNGDRLFALPDVGGIEHPPEKIPSHLQPGAMSTSLLEDTLTLHLTAELRAGHILVTAVVFNHGAGHHVPTDFPGRNVILDIRAEDSSGMPLGLLRGPTIPDWGGDLAGRPGVGFAKILRDVASAERPIVSYWKQSLIDEDTRLPALAYHVSSYELEAPQEGRQAVVTAALRFRRLFWPLSEAKQWDTPETLMEQTQIQVPSFTLDLDGDATVSAATDGRLALRYLFGFRGEELTRGALGADATRDTPQALETYLQTWEGALDADADGREDALTDGILIIRYLLGRRGVGLIAGAVAADAGRATPSAVEAYLGSIAPTVSAPDQPDR